MKFPHQSERRLSNRSTDLITDSRVEQVFDVQGSLSRYMSHLYGELKGRLENRAMLTAARLYEQLSALFPDRMDLLTVDEKRFLVELFGSEVKQSHFDHFDTFQHLLYKPIINLYYTKFLDPNHLKEFYTPNQQNSILKITRNDIEQVLNHSPKDGLTDFYDAIKSAYYFILFSPQERSHILTPNVWKNVQEVLSIPGVDSGYQAKVHRGSICMLRALFPEHTKELVTKDLIAAEKTQLNKYIQDEAWSDVVQSGFKLAMITAEHVSIESGYVEFDFGHTIAQKPLPSRSLV